jgi:hypothetical protein
MHDKIFLFEMSAVRVFFCFTGLALGAPFASNDLELPPEYVPAAIVSALNSSSSSVVGVGADYFKHDEITGQEYSAGSVEAYAIAALKPSGAWVFKPEVIRRIAAAHARSTSDDLHFVRGDGPSAPAEVA